MSVKGYRPAKKKHKKQMGAIMFGNILVHEVFLGVGEELQKTHGWDKEKIAGFVKVVSARVRANTRPPSEASTEPDNQ